MMSGGSVTVSEARSPMQGIAAEEMEVNKVEARIAIRAKAAPHAPLSVQKLIETMEKGGRTGRDHAGRSQRRCLLTCAAVTRRSRTGVFRTILFLRERLPGRAR
jgi:hypothetical protein